MTIDNIAWSRDAGQARETAQTANTPKPSETGEGFWGDDGFTFHDLLDIVNPLQHLPIVSTIYRGLTGDSIAQGPRVLGGALFGGPGGMFFAVMDTAVEAHSGKTFGENIVDTLGQAVTGAAAAPATMPQTPVVGAPGMAARAAAEQSDADFWAMRLSAAETPPGMIAGAVLTPPSAITDIDFAQFSARSAPGPQDDGLDGYIRGGAADGTLPAAPPAPRLSAPVGPLSAQEAPEPEIDVFAEMMRGFDQYDALRARAATDES